MELSKQRELYGYFPSITFRLYEQCESVDIYPMRGLLIRILVFRYALYIAELVGLLTSWLYQEFRTIIIGKLEGAY